MSQEYKQRVVFMRTFFSSVSAKAVSFFSSKRFLKLLFCCTSWIALTNLLYNSSRSPCVCSKRCRNTSCSQSSLPNSCSWTRRRAFALYGRGKYIWWWKSNEEFNNVFIDWFWRATANTCWYSFMNNIYLFYVANMWFEFRDRSSILICVSSVQITGDSLRQAVYIVP